MIQAGQLFTDGTAVFIVDDVRDYIPVGMVIYLPILRQGYVKANGATVQRADYPRLVQFADAYNLWTDNPATYPAMYGVGDGKTTMILPDYRGRVIQGGDNVAVLEAGLPNITGTYNLDSCFGTNLSGAYYISGGGLKRTQGKGEDNGSPLMNFNAARSSAIYGASNTVQPPAIQLIAQIKY